MSLILISLLVAYSLFLVLLVVGWTVTSETAPLGSPTLFYSIIVPFRNEEKNLPNLLKSLDKLVFPKNNYEIILVDDHSEDDPQSVLNTIDNNNLHVLKLEGQTGKKAALALGIEEAKGDVIVTTDADCIVQPTWLCLLANFFEERSAKMVFGGVAFANARSFFDNVQQVEFASLIGSGAASLKMGMPSMCNGANMAFLRKTFFEVNGYNDNAEIPSGDDEFLMHKVYAKYPKAIFYTKNTQSVVYTKPLKSITGFFQQRKRWASKWKSYGSIKNSLLAILVLLFNVSVIGGVVLIFASPSVLELGILLLGKVMLELIFLYAVIRKLGVRFSFMAFIFLQICYPFYVALFGLTANFGQYTWKGRKHKF